MEPRRLQLGSRSLQIIRILERSELTGACRFQVRVSDGRRFVIRHESASGRWELAAVYAREQLSRRLPSNR